MKPMSEPEIVYIVYEISGEYDDYEKIVRYAFYNHDLAEKCVKLLEQQEEERVKFEAELYELTGTYNEYTHGLSYRYLIDTLTICDANEEEDDEAEIIRCKDCRFFVGRWCMRDSAKEFDPNDRITTANNYCSFAERKEHETEEL